MKGSDYKLNAEFQLEDFNEAEEKLVINTLNHSILVDGNSKIIDGYININNPNIETLLVGYLNR